jgi:hypothetical protein
VSSFFARTQEKRLFLFLAFLETMGSRCGCTSEGANNQSRLASNRRLRQLRQLRQHTRALACASYMTVTYMRSICGEWKDLNATSKIICLIFAPALHDSFAFEVIQFLSTISKGRHPPNNTFICISTFIFLRYRKCYSKLLLVWA